MINLARWVFAGQLMLGALAGAAVPERFDLVLAGGLVMDPESGLEAIRNVAVKDGKIAAISVEPLSGFHIVDVRGRVVAPGFVDLHSHSQNLIGGRVQAFDGVTTALEQEVGQLPVHMAYSKTMQGGRAINYGYTVSWGLARASVLANAQPDGTVEGTVAILAAMRTNSGASALGPAKEPQLGETLALIERGLDEGATGIGLPLGYFPGATAEEVFEVSRLAARRGVSVFTHLRSTVSDFAATQEVVANAVSTGAHWHIMHVYWDSQLQNDMLDQAVKAGVPITPETKGWFGGSTFITAPFLLPQALRDRHETPNIIYYGRHVTTFDELERLQSQTPGALVIEVEEHGDETELGKRNETARRLKTPGWTLASDAMPWTDHEGRLIPPTTWPLPPDAWAHPRSAGNFSRVIQNYVNEWKLVGLMDVLRAGALNPALELQASVPQMKSKGRIKVGADADIIVFDPAKIAALATEKTPARLATGMDYVLVNGELLIFKGRLDKSLLPGKPIRRDIVPSSGKAL